jgi:penicillin-binding protein 2
VAGVCIEEAEEPSLARAPTRSRPWALPVHPLEPVWPREPRFERTVAFYGRVGILGAIAVAAFGALGLRLWSLQVLQHPRYVRAALSQASRVVPVQAGREPIVDRQGRLLAGTEARVVVGAPASALGNTRHGVWRPSRRGAVVLGRLARAADGSVATFVRRIRRSLARSPYAPVPLLSPSGPLADYLDEHALAFPGVRVEAIPVRSYPQGALGGEFLGLLGEIDRAQLREPYYRGYQAGQVIGQSGVEAQYDRLVNGGLERVGVTVDALGRPFGRLHRLGHPHRQGGLRLTIDARLQRAAARAIRDGIALARAAGYADADAGAAVVMNPRTGALSALASYPGFNEAAAGRDRHYLARLLAGGSPLLLNRATQGLYPLGSTFKPIVAEAALASGLIEPWTPLPCTDSLTVGNHVFHNVEAGVNALLTLPQALSISCDTWFYRLGTSFYGRGSLAMQEWATRLGLGRPTGIDLPGEAAGIVPTPAWLQRTFTAPSARVWYEGYSVNLSIGQGSLAATPLQLAVAYSALANGGTVVRPHVADAVLGPSGRMLRKLRFPPRAHVRLSELWAIRQGLFMAAHEGTSATVFASYPIPVAGKTGTAQSPSGSDDSWYASWAPANDARVVVVVLIEHGGFGADAAAPAAREIYDSLFHIGRS